MKRTAATPQLPALVRGPAAALSAAVLTALWLAFFPSSTDAARVPEYTISLQVEPVNADIPTELNLGLQYRLPASETGADSSNYRFREMRASFRLQGKVGNAYEYRASINQQTGINFSTLWTLHYVKKRRAVEIRFNDAEYDIRSYAGETFFVEAPATTPRDPVLQLVGTIALRDGRRLLSSPDRARIDVALDVDTAAKTDLSYGPVDIELSDGRPVLQVLPSGEHRVARFANLAEVGAGATIVPPAASRMFRVRIGTSGTQMMTTMNPRKPGERLLLIRHSDIVSWAPPKPASPVMGGAKTVTLTNIVTIPMTNMVTVTRTNVVRNIVNVPKTNLVTVTRTNVVKNIVNVPMTNIVTVTKTNLVKVTKPVGITAVFALLPQDTPGLVATDFELGFQDGTAAPKSMGAFDAKGSLTTAMLPKVDRKLPLFFRRKGEAAWKQLPEAVNPSSQSPLNIIDATTLLPGEPVQFSAVISAKTAPAGSRAASAKVALLAAGKPSGIAGSGSVAAQPGAPGARWNAAVAGALPAKLNQSPLEVRVELPGFRQTRALEFDNLAALKQALASSNGSLDIPVRQKVAPEARGLAIVIDPARRWTNFTPLRNRITDELFNRIDARKGLRAPLLVGSDRGPYDIVSPDDFKNPDFDLYSFFFNGFRDQAVRSGMMTPKGAAEIVGSMEDRLALAPQLEVHGGWDIVCLMPHNPGGETVGSVPDKETVQNLIDGLKLADARLLIVENGSTSRYLTALQDRVERMTGDKTLVRYQSRKELNQVMELVIGEIDRFVPKP